MVAPSGWPPLIKGVLPSETLQGRPSGVGPAFALSPAAGVKCLALPRSLQAVSLCVFKHPPSLCKHRFSEGINHMGNSCSQYLLRPPKLLHFRPLMDALTNSLTAQPFSASLISVLENLPKVQSPPPSNPAPVQIQVDLSVLSRPLVQTLAYSRHLRPLLISLYNTDIDKCQ